MTASDPKAREGNEGAPPSAADLRSEVESLRSRFAAAENYAQSLKAETTHLISENRRLRKATEEMRAELLVLNQFMEQLHAASEQVELFQEKLASTENKLASTENKLASTENKLASTENKLASTDKKVAQAEARLASAYSSRSWRLTAPLRWCDDVQRNIVARLREPDH